ncbi:hypothetical protein QBC35DRAFT_78320 [Podospora australis]|uniref:Phosphoribosyltransferase domain-containing protein n=1 Tax=Podospora australis TaxID=1536484 RepID=A0AAN6WL18_9PEZI|nr:hypothetical protein QBC35DRAFT_78320 [Podospora australis]
MATGQKPVMIGIYGVPGSGKSHLLRQLRNRLPSPWQVFYLREFRDAIDTVAPGGFSKFQLLSKKTKSCYRVKAMDYIRDQCDLFGGRTGVVAHQFLYVVWEKDKPKGCTVHTPSDFQNFTHIIYLDVSPAVIAMRRPEYSIEDLTKWQWIEMLHLRDRCRTHGILFTTLSDPDTMADKASALIETFRLQTPEYNLQLAETQLSKIISDADEHPRTMLVFDADGTLAAEDAGHEFFRVLARRGSPLMKRRQDVEPLALLHRSKLGYSATAFQQAVLLYDEYCGSDEEFEDICEEVAASIRMHPELAAFLEVVAAEEHVGAVVVTSRLRRVWKMVLESECLSGKVEVIGGGRTLNELVVTPDVKSHLVHILRCVHRRYVCAFGDSTQDLDMLCRAHRAIVVVGEPEEHSGMEPMENELGQAIDEGTLTAQQILLPPHVPARLDPQRLPLVRVSDSAFLKMVFDGNHPDGKGMRPQILDATKRGSAKILMTLVNGTGVIMANKTEVQQLIGWYLASELLTDMVGMEEYNPRPRRRLKGYQLKDEESTMLVSVMEDGEPFARDVHDALPLCSIIHVNHAGELTPERLKIPESRTILLVDSTINTGDTMAAFLGVIGGMNQNVRIVMVVGQMSEKLIAYSSPLGSILWNDENVGIVALQRTGQRPKRQ